MNDTITIPELQPGMILFFHGIKFLAKRIHWFQKLKYPKFYINYNGKAFYYYLLNHIGHLDKDIDNSWLVYQQDNPGRYSVDRLDYEYLRERGDVWIGVPKISAEKLKEGMRGLRQEAEILAGEDCLLNYSYKSFIGFMADAICYKLFKKDCWITGEPSGTTCSQIVAKLYQIHFKMFMWKKWYQFYPVEIAMSPEIELKKLIY